MEVAVGSNQMHICRGCYNRQTQRAKIEPSLLCWWPLVHYSGGLMCVEQTPYCSECGQDDQGWSLLLYTHFIFSQVYGYGDDHGVIAVATIGNRGTAAMAQTLPQPCSRGAAEQSRCPRLIFVDHFGEGHTIAIFTRREECSTI